MTDENNVVPLRPEAIQANGARKRGQRLANWVGETLQTAQVRPAGLTEVELREARNLLRHQGTADEAE